MRRLLAIACALSVATPAGAHMSRLKHGGVTPAQTLLHCLASGEESLILNGSSGTYASTPDSAALDITGDIDLRAKVAMVDWTPGSTQAIVAKWHNGGTDRSYSLSLNDLGHLVLDLSSDGTNTGTATSSAATGFTDGATKCARAAWRNSDDRVQFFTSGDSDCATWSQLGTDQTLALAAIHASTTQLAVGTINTVTFIRRLTGRIYSASVRNGIDGTVVASFDADDCAAGADGGDTCTSSATSEVWTLNGAANVASRDLSCVTSETLTFTRSTVGPLCAPGAASGTSGENATNLWEPSANQACFSDSLGVRVVGSIKNELCGSETLNDSQVGCDWIPGVDGATVTLDQADSPLAGTDTLADAVSDGSAATAQRIRQSLALSTQGRYRESAWMKVGTGAATGSLEVEVDTTPVATTQTCDKSLTTSWQRFDCTLDASALTFTTVVARIYPRDASEVTQTGDAHVWGVSLNGPNGADNGAILVPYCRSLGTSATTCGMDVLTTPESVRNVSGGVALDVTPLFDPSAGQTFGGGGGPVFVAATGGSGGTMLFRDNGIADLRTHDGTSQVTLSAAGWTALVTKRISVGWSGGTRTLRNVTDATSASGTYDGTWGGTYRLGSSDAPGRSAFSYLKDVKVFSKPKTTNP